MIWEVLFNRTRHLCVGGDFDRFINKHVIFMNSGDWRVALVCHRYLRNLANRSNMPVKALEVDLPEQFFQWISISYETIKFEKIL